MVKDFSQPPFQETIQWGLLSINGPNYKKDFITSPSEWRIHESLQSAMHANENL